MSSPGPAARQATDGVIRINPRVTARRCFQFSARWTKLCGNDAGSEMSRDFNRGKADGVEVGHVLALYSLGATVRDTSKPKGAADERIQLPNERVGLAFVFRVFDRISYALVMQISRPVRPLDVVQTP